MDGVSLGDGAGGRYLGRGAGYGKDDRSLGERGRMGGVRERARETRGGSKEGGNNLLNSASGEEERRGGWGRSRKWDESRSSLSVGIVSTGA